jgi:hypothetical protein
MSLFWLAYRQDGLACVLILEASSLISARLKASLQTPGIDEHFVSGFELPREQDVPTEAVARLLSQAEAHQVAEGARADDSQEAGGRLAEAGRPPAQPGLIVPLLAIVPFLGQS